MLKHYLNWYSIFPLYPFLLHWRKINHLFNIFLQLLQNLGKADKTTDEIFEEHLQNFNQQQAHSTRLHKDINNYIRCIRGMYVNNKYRYLPLFIFQEKYILNMIFGIKWHNLNIKDEILPCSHNRVANEVI